ncbi:cholinesterase 2 [Aplysia californica]|uniref:Carboxylic ester hydrolase n=1 Tax=Aplysia californica TaxID=6500 RepID=A0ABM0JS76_APLCA|nr:cholinesterase 2 [Aplysia californica]
MAHFSFLLVVPCLCLLTERSVGIGFQVTEVNAPWGQIKGVQKVSVDGVPYASFEGVPYAEPPLGNLRFAKPVLSKKNNGSSPYLASAPKPRCAGWDVTFSDMSEDCLFLDIYVPQTNSSQALPVLLYIHGGGFAFAIERHDPEGIIGRNCAAGPGCLLAFVNYRLGAFGFLSTGDDVAKGNWGLWDQRAALLWLKDNIGAFGGDPNNINIFGESAGAASVSYQLLSPQSKGLFRRAVMHSGSATSTWAFQRHPAAMANRLAQTFGCGQSTSSNAAHQALVACLRSKSSDEIKNKTFELLDSLPEYTQVADYLFVPVVDGDFVVDEPRRLLKNVSFLQSQLDSGIDILAGNVNNEGAHMMMNKKLSKPPKFGDFFTKQLLFGELTQRYGHSTPEAEAVVDQFYRHGADLLSLMGLRIAEAHGDPGFVMPSIENARAISDAQQSISGGGKTYFYYFNYCPSYTGQMCMMHGWDVGFLFPKGHMGNAEDDKMSGIYSRMVTSFASAGRPDVGLKLTWPVYSKSTGGQYVMLSSTPQVLSNLLPKRTQLWLDTLDRMMEDDGPLTQTPVVG